MPAKHGRGSSAREDPSIDAAQPEQKSVAGGASRRCDSTHASLRYRGDHRCRAWIISILQLTVRQKLIDPVSVVNYVWCMNRTKPKQRARALQLLCEGMSIRAIERTTGVTTSASDHRPH